MKRPSIFISLAVVVSLSACGSSDSSKDAAPDTVAPATSEAASISAEVLPTDDASVVTVAAASGPNEVDARFGAGGLGHHAQAVEIAEIALDPKAKARPEVLAIGKAITAPSPEFDAIEGLLTKWGKPLALSKEEMAKMEGMATQDTIAELETLSGPEFDRAFLETLVKHHEGAIKMADKAVNEGSDLELRPIAQKLVEIRTAQLASFKELLGTL